MTHNIPQSTLDALGQLDDRDIFRLLGEILEPSVKTPFKRQSDELTEAMWLLSDKYQIEYDAITDIMGWSK